MYVGEIEWFENHKRILIYNLLHFEEGYRDEIKIIVSHFNTWMQRFRKINRTLILNFKFEFTNSKFPQRDRCSSSLECKQKQGRHA